MPRVANGESGAFHFKVKVTATEHPALFRDLMGLTTGGKRIARLYLLAHLGLALEGMREGQIPGATAVALAMPMAADEPLRLSGAELDDEFEDTSTRVAEQEA